MRKILLSSVFIGSVFLLVNQGSAMNNEEFTKNVKKPSDEVETIDSDSPRAQLSVFLNKLALSDPKQALDLLNQEILNVFKSFSSLSGDSIKYEVAEIYQKLGDRLLNKKDFDNSAKAYILSLKIVKDNYDLECFLNELDLSYVLAISSLNLDTVDPMGELKKKISSSLHEKYK